MAFRNFVLRLGGSSGGGGGPVEPPPIPLDVLPRQYVIHDKIEPKLNPWLGNAPIDETYEPARGGIIATSNGRLFTSWRTGAGITGSWFAYDSNNATGLYRGTLRGTTPWASVANVGAPDTEITFSGTGLTRLVSKWQREEKYPGFYLTASNSGWAQRFAGRGATVGKPQLIITTNIATYICNCVATYWNTTTQSAFQSDQEWLVQAGSGPALLRPDMAHVNGRVISAELKIYCLGNYSGGSAARDTINIYEADMPEWRFNSRGKPRTLGIAAGYTGDENLSNHPAVIDAGSGEVGSPFRVFNPATSPYRTYVYDPDRQKEVIRVTMPANNPDAQEGSPFEYTLTTPTATGRPNILYPEIFFRFYIYIENNYKNGNIVTSKFPGFGQQFGCRGPLGAWLNDWGNGGTPGDGRVGPYVNGSNTNTGIGAGLAYFGHSVRAHLHVSADPSSTAPLKEFQTLGWYHYNIDQGGNFPKGWIIHGGEACPEPVQVGTYTGRWVCIEQRMKMNTINYSVGPDQYGNYEANFDGVLTTWVDGIKAWELTNVRWCRHPDFLGIERLFPSFFQGGSPALSTQKADISYRMSDIVVATQYIGPRTPPLPSWRRALGSNQVANINTTNSWQSIDPGIGNWRIGTSNEFDMHMNAYSGGVLNPYIGEYGAMIIHGGGHGDSLDNSVLALNFNNLTWQRLGDPSLDATAGLNTPLPGPQDLDRQFAEVLPGRKPVSHHSYDGLVIVPPYVYDAEFGSLVTPYRTAFHRLSGNTSWAHRFNIHLLDTSTPEKRAQNTWKRCSINGYTAANDINYGGSINTDAGADASLIYGNSSPASVWDPVRERIWWVAGLSNGPAFIMYLDVKTGQQVRVNHSAANVAAMYVDTPIMQYIPTRDWLVLTGCVGGANGTIVAYSMDLQNVADGWRPINFTGTPIPINPSIGSNIPFTYVDPLDKLYLLSYADNTGAYEVTIPATRTGNWSVVKQPFSGGTITAEYITGKRWSWNQALRCIVYKQRAALPSYSSFQVYVPPGV